MGGMFVNYRYWGRKPLLYSLRFHRQQLERSKNNCDAEGRKELQKLKQRLAHLEDEIRSRPFDPLVSYYFQGRLAHLQQQYLRWQQKYDQTSVIKVQQHQQDADNEESIRINRVPIGKHRLPPLPYRYDALEPYIDEQTMRLHHDLHHQGYVDGLNRAELEMEKARKTGDFKLLKHWEREAAFHGAGHYLHTIFWYVMHPKGGGKPSGRLLRQIEKDFGSFNQFQQHFSEAAKQVEGSGWAILIWSPRAHRLEILQAEKHQNLSQWDGVPLLPLDVWEHAYYLKYQNKRDEYIKNWWNVVYWPEVEKRFAVARKVRWEPF